MPKVPVTICLELELKDVVDIRAKKMGVSRSVLIDEALKLYLEIKTPAIEPGIDWPKYNLNNKMPF